MNNQSTTFKSGGKHLLLALTFAAGVRASAASASAQSNYTIENARRRINMARSSRAIILAVIFTAGIVVGNYAHATADTTAPQVVSINFTPKSVDVSSASQIVTVTARITDDDTGLSGGAAGFYSPSSNQSAEVRFSPYNRISGTAQDGVYQTTMTIPKSSEAGTWKMSYYFVYDVVGNIRELGPSYNTPYPAGTPVDLVVTSTTADMTLPQLVSIAFTPSSVDVSSSSQAVTVTAHASDDNTGVTRVWCSFFSPSRNQQVYITHQQVYVTLNRISGTARDGMYQGTATIPKSSTSGNWTLASVEVTDAVQNNAYYSAEEDGGQPFPVGTSTTLAVTSTTADATGPQLVSVGLTPSSVNVSSYSQAVTVTAHLSDDNTGITDAYFYFYSPSFKQYVYVGLDRISGTARDGMFQGTITIPRSSESGNWTLASVKLTDAVQNFTDYSTAPGGCFPAGACLPFPSGISATLSVSNDLTTQTIQHIETESATVQALYGATHSRISDSNLSGGAGTQLNATGTGKYVIYTVPVSVAGTYKVKIGVRTGAKRGIFRLSIGGVTQGTAQDEYTSTIGYGVRDLGTVTMSTGGNKGFKFLVTGKNAKSGGYSLGLDYIELVPATATTRSETESLKVAAISSVPSGWTSSQWFGVFNATAASGGAGTYFNANGVGKFITYTVPVAKAGTYRVKVGVQTKPNKGMFQLAINGLNVGQVQDEYSPSITYGVRDVGTVAISAGGNYAFKFTVTGKNASSTGYGLAFDYIELVPQ